jgi:hypothetical protein
MTRLLTTLLLSLTLTVPASLALAHGDHGKPMYGGVFVEAGEAQFEVVAKDGKVTVYATLHGTPLATTGATGKVTALAGTAKTEVALKATTENRLEGKGDLPAGAKLLVNVQWPGKSALQGRAVMP